MPSLLRVNHSVPLLECSVSKRKEETVSGRDSFNITLQSGMETTKAEFAVGTYNGISDLVNTLKITFLR